ncbi:hypothetical protein JXA31_08130 [Candidatus Bathyarchaeota archaeon]|nr:hypothetical protein [Candidatus Bathyarchaeota archaeon]
MVESCGKNGNIESIRQRVFALLDENPCLTAKSICEKLKLPYYQNRNYMYKTKSEWKSYRQKQRGSNCSSIHSWRGWCRVPDYVDRILALELGWKRTKAKNRWLLWKEKRGRMEWFETGRVNLHVTSPVNLGKIKQLVCNGFGFTGLIFDDKVLQKVLDTIHVTGEHYVFETGRPLPKKTINNFKKSRGLTIKIGDKSHPKAVEVISSVPDWAEKFDRFVDRLSDFFDLSAPSQGSKKKPDYIV